MSLFHEGDDVWSEFNSTETTSKPAVHREQEAAQTMLGPRQSIGLGEKKASVAFLSQDNLVLILFFKEPLSFHNAAPRS